MWDSAEMILINMKSNHRLSPREVTKGAAPDPGCSASCPCPVTVYHHVPSYKAPYNRTLLACLPSLLLPHNTMANGSALMTNSVTVTDRPPNNMVRYPLFISVRVCSTVYLAVEIFVTPTNHSCQLTYSI